MTVPGGLSHKVKSLYRVRAALSRCAMSHMTSCAVFQVLYSSYAQQLLEAVVGHGNLESPTNNTNEICIEKEKRRSS